MIMADVLKIVLIIVGFLIVFVSYWLASEALFPRIVERSQRQYHQHPIRITLLGLIVGVPLTVLGIAILNKSALPPLKLVGGVLLVVPILIGLLGSSGLTRRIGLGLPSPIDENQPWRRVLRGGIVLSLTFLLPFAGWFMILPWTIVSGFGAAVLSFRRGRDEPGPAPPAANIEAAPA